jgi:hypothetical protein
MGAAGVQGDPGIAAGSGQVLALVNAPSEAISVRPFTEGAAGAWQTAVSTGGYLADAAIAASHGRFYVVGRNALGDVWWYESGSGAWTYYGFSSSVASAMTAAPR